MRTAIWTLQEALFQRLTTNAALIALITATGVYDDELPTGEKAMPYIVLGADTVTDYSTKTWDGEELTKTFHIWSSYEGRKEAANIMDLALQAITASPLELAAGFSFDFCRLEMLEVFKEEGNFHGVMRLRFKIKQN